MSDSEISTCWICGQLEHACHCLCRPREESLFAARCVFTDVERTCLTVARMVIRASGGWLLRLHSNQQSHARTIPSGQIRLPLQLLAIAGTSRRCRTIGSKRSSAGGVCDLGSISPR